MTLIFEEKMVQSLHLAFLSTYAFSSVGFLRIGKHKCNVLILSLGPHTFLCSGKFAMVTILGGLFIFPFL